jgi:hypothetical protein
MPVVNITAWPNIQPAVTVIPAIINLPPAPLANKVTTSVTIQNNSTNALALSDASMDPKDVEMKLVETQPGRTFTATFDFPEGWDMAMSGGRAEFKAKSNSSRIPVISVMVMQPPRPAIIPINVVPQPIPTLVPPPAAPKPSAATNAPTAERAAK